MEDKFKTPDLSHLTSSHFDSIYEPAEDSFLLLDTIEREYPFISSLNPNICVEIGCGSGLVITFLARLFPNSLCFGTDINYSAVAAARATAQSNNVHVELIKCDLLSAVEDRLKNSIDILIFNPPYVVTTTEEISDSNLSRAWAGGIDGREVIDRVLPLISHFLSMNGVFYLVVINENKPLEIEKVMDSYGFTMTIVLSRRCGSERLSVLKFIRNSI